MMMGLEMAADELLEGLRQARAALAERLQAVDRARICWRVFAA
jgi:hypothetical protein